MMRIFSRIESSVTARGTCESGKWVVTSPTRVFSATIIIVNRAVFDREAMNSVCPGTLNPALAMASLEIGAVTMASTFL
jgi:hypothetical protein